MKSSTETLVERIEQRLDALSLNPRAASVKAGLKVDAVRNILRAARSGKPYNPRSDTLQQIATALETSVSWLMGGVEGPEKAGYSRRAFENITVARSLLKEAVMFVLIAEGVPADRAELIADILPEALSGPPVEAVDRDPLLSFRVHYQLEARRSERPAPR